MLGTNACGRVEAPFWSPRRTVYCVLETVHTSTLLVCGLALTSLDSVDTAVPCVLGTARDEGQRET